MEKRPRILAFDLAAAILLLLLLLLLLFTFLPRSIFATKSCDGGSPNGRKTENHRKSDKTSKVRKEERQQIQRKDGMLWVKAVLQPIQSPWKVYDERHNGNEKRCRKSGTNPPNALRVRTRTTKLYAIHDHKGM